MDHQLKDTDQKCYWSDYYDFTVNKYGVKMRNIVKILGSKRLN